MSSPRNTDYLCAYDISDNKERRKVESLLKGYGFRRQLSLFICRLTRGTKEKLMRQLTALNLQTGFILIAPMAHHKLKIIGECHEADLDSGDAFII